MKFSVGYQLTKNGSFTAAVKENRDKIGEIYFALPEFANGRNGRSVETELTDYEYRERMETELRELSALNIPFNWLLNAECYGRHAQSRAFFNNIGNTADYLISRYGLKSVTTTSPLIAKFFKQNFPETDVRASVNMEIGTAVGMDYIAEYFDSFYLKREYNRDFGKIAEIKGWCADNGKRLFGLANSGCLNYCSVHTFHDNLVAHENEAAEMDNAYQFEGQCRIYLKNGEKRKKWLSISNFIRPEDVALYEGLFDGLKLATRVNRNAAGVIRAYCCGSYSGNLPGLLEPDHSALFYPAVIENKKIPDDFGVKTASCDKRCEKCGYCEKALANALLCLE